VEREREAADWRGAGTERRAGVKKIGLSGERQIGRSRSAHMLWLRTEHRHHDGGNIHITAGGLLFYGHTISDVWFGGAVRNASWFKDHVCLPPIASLHCVSLLMGLSTGCGLKNDPTPKCDYSVIPENFYAKFFTLVQQGTVH